MKLETGSLGVNLQKYGQTLLKYAGVLFAVFVAVIYGIMIWRINALAGIQPEQIQIDAQLKTVQVPHIDQNALKKIQDLQDNSVSVQSLFNQARDNPFQE